MGIDVEATTTPIVQQKVVYSSTSSSSYQQASDQLAHLAGVEIAEKRVARISQRTGCERLAQRERRLEEYQALPLPQRQEPPADAPAGIWQNRVAGVFMDGGRMQLRNERWGQPPAPGGKKHRWWKESKVSLLATLSSMPHDADPLPAIPLCLLNPLWLVPKINEIKAAQGGASAAADIDAGLKNAPPDDPTPPDDPGTPPDDPPRWSPEPLVRSVVGTLKRYRHLGELTRVEAYHRGFDQAERKAFVADGLKINWAIQRKYFSSYTPVVDLMHALSYVYQAAKESTPDMEVCWQRCTRWIQWTWEGNVNKVIAEIQQQLALTTVEEARKALTESHRYLSNNAGRMRYDEYRRDGLPITTALMESTIKQINRRMKGTEKFWSAGAEAQLQLCTDTLSETQPLVKYWQNRKENCTGLRKSRTTT